ncbi:septum formation family protein [Leifsonia sp. TF02-11]|uniref:septum formation family protein n=1 Tax=Leifsonia sp. TF02-11 TaxID=2815212 RepID=UPI001AA0F8C8|nr:septum formation family protein [Leifsonia sp. TF02-11]MBO1739534.1 septum formation family protein [Leifsonia sp. TF02-11]
MSGPRDWRPDGWDERTRRAPAKGGTFGRGVALSLLVVPLGVGAWLLLAQLGWMTSLIPLGVAVLACLLFRYGSGGPVSARGGVAVSIVVVGTVIVGVIVGHTAAAVRGYSGSDAGVAVLADPGFWRSFGDGFLTSPSMRQALFWNIGIGLLFGAIGTIPTLARHLTQLRVGQRLLLLAWPFVATGAVVAVAAVGLIGGGASPAAATAQSPGVGACLDEDIRQDAVIDHGKTPIIVPCDEPHRAEVFYVGELTGEGVPAAYPGEQEVSRLATVQCSGPMAEFLGIAREASKLNLNLYFPAEESWKTGDRHIVCAVRDPAVDRTEGTLRGAAR